MWLMKTCEKYLLDNKNQVTKDLFSIYSNAFISKFPIDLSYSSPPFLQTTRHNQTFWHKLMLKNSVFVYNLKVLVCLWKFNSFSSAQVQVKCIYLIVFFSSNYKTANFQADLLIIVVSIFPIPEANNIYCGGKKNLIPICQKRRSTTLCRAYANIAKLFEDVSWT